MKFPNRHKKLLCATVLSVAAYILFFGPFLTPSYYFWGSTNGPSDAQAKHLPARTYLYNKIVQEHTFPFWTEKAYSGFPIYADLENAYLHPANVVSVLIFGPKLSYKILHIFEYLIGSLSLYFLLKRKGIGILGFAAANVIFYFNTFFINHQIHFNFIMAFYLFPTALLLADLFLEKKQLRYIVLQSLVVANGILWGHMQMVAIMLMGVFIYMVVYSIKKIRFSTFIFYFTALTFLVTLLTLPQILPTYELFKESDRSQGLNYLKGSFNPRMAIGPFVPYLFGNHDNFIGKKINDDYTYTEIYIYLGLSSVILSALALLFLKKSREIILAFAFIWAFLIFAFMSHNNIFPNETPLITMFRDWGRTIALSSFGIALLAGILVDKINEISYKNIKTGILFLLAPVIYIWILDATQGKFSKQLKELTSFHYIQTYPYFPMLKTIALVLTCIILAFVILKKFSRGIPPKILLSFQIILVGLVFFDLTYFNKDVLSFRLQNISSFQLGSVPSELQNKRVILNAMSVEGMESLYYGSWNPFGTSQLKQKDYVQYYNKELDIGLGGITNSSAILLYDYQKLKKAGIVAVLDANGINYLNNNKLDIIKNDLEGEYLNKEEGHIIMRFDNPEDTTVNTYLRYSPYWKVKIDGQTSDIKKNGIFFDFPLVKGNHVVEIYYYPEPFYVGMFYSFLLLIFSFGWYYSFRKTLYSTVLR